MREIILNFHGIGEPPTGTERAERRYWLEESFFLSVLDHLSATRWAAGPAARITFDDGNMSDAEIALPALAKRGLTASFFICAGRIGMPGYLDAAAIHDLSSGGMSIGSHGVHHRDWRKLDDTELDEEIAGARRMLEDLGGAAIDEAAIPFGSYDRRVLAKLRLEGYRRAYTSDGGVVRPDSWLKARNTLDRFWQHKNVVDELAARDTLTKRLRRTLACRYKALR